MVRSELCWERAPRSNAQRLEQRRHVSWRQSSRSDADSAKSFPLKGQTRSLNDTEQQHAGNECHGQGEQQRVPG